jgi:hypothetical protein
MPEKVIIHSPIILVKVVGTPSSAAVPLSRGASKARGVIFDHVGARAVVVEMSRPAVIQLAAY